MGDWAPGDQESVTAGVDFTPELFELAAEIPYRKYLEPGNFFRAVGDISGCTVLDLACGDGVYTRRFPPLGAAQVTGADLDPALIEHARDLERAHPRGIEYLVADVVEMGKIGEYDLVAAVHLLQFATNEAQLARMCRNVFANLGSGGRFVTIVGDSRYRTDKWSSARNFGKYGIAVTLPRNPRDGDEITIEINTDPSFVITNVFWSRETYERVLFDCGFRSVQWVPLVPPTDADAGPPEFWQSYLDNPHIAIVDCRK
ncbi:class I SAM-dependent methyltransferase [Nocardia sp. 2YAB30]|uniref:class I SAM-dependent methyltransferase n=1 Tax=unclassified Nocardia TaxID=2637762 RepID=UPI003F951583